MLHSRRTGARMAKHRKPNLTEIKPTGMSFVQTLALLANEVRIEVLASLGRTSKSVGEIVRDLELDYPTVSHALRELRNGDLVIHEVIKKRHIYRLTNAVTMTFRASTVQIEITTGTGKVCVQTCLRGRTSTSRPAEKDNPDKR